MNIKLMFSVAALFCIVLLSSCKKDKDNPSPEPTPIPEYAALKVGNYWVYETYFTNAQITDVFVPVQTTDFIFSLYSRNFGFFGGLILLSLWILFFFRVNRIIKLSQIEFEKYLLSGLLILLGVQIFINLLTILGFIPLTGIPFPLLSLGGSSIFSTAIIFGLINRVFIENNIVV